MFSTRRVVFLLAGAGILFILWSIPQTRVYRYIYVPSSANQPASPTDRAKNATLGFEKILALSARPSWRTRGLQAAANITGLQIDIPTQPPINPDIVNSFAGILPHPLSDDNEDTETESEKGPTIKKGASKAWISHLDLLKFVIQAGFESALILEDDVDFDLGIKHTMGLVSDAVRELDRVTTSDSTPSFNQTDPNDDGNTPYGNSWDILWIGHCAESWNSPSDGDGDGEAENSETVFIKDDDPSVPSHSSYQGFSKADVSRLPEYTRAVFHSHAPICSFAYAVSRLGAVRILNEVGGGATGNTGSQEAFDLALLAACQDRNRLRCVSVLPEVMHQYFPKEEFGVVSLVDVGNGVVGDVEGEDRVAAEGAMGSTENIVYSARCFALWWRACLKV